MRAVKRTNVGSIRMSPKPSGRMSKEAETIVSVQCRLHFRLPNIVSLVLSQYRTSMVRTTIDELYFKVGYEIKGFGIRRSTTTLATWNGHVTPLTVQWHKKYHKHASGRQSPRSVSVGQWRGHRVDCYDCFLDLFGCYDFWRCCAIYTTILGHQELKKRRRFFDTCLFGFACCQHPQDFLLVRFYVMLFR